MSVGSIAIAQIWLLTGCNGDHIWRQIQKQSSRSILTFSSHSSNSSKERSLVGGGNSGVPAPNPTVAKSVSKMWFEWQSLSIHIPILLQMSTLIMCLTWSDGVVGLRRIRTYPAMTIRARDEIIFVVALLVVCCMLYCACIVLQAVEFLIVFNLPWEELEEVIHSMLGCFKFLSKPLFTLSRLYSFFNKPFTISQPFPFLWCK